MNIEELLQLEYDEYMQARAQFALAVLHDCGFFTASDAQAFVYAMQGAWARKYYENKLQQLQKEDTNG